MFTKAAQMVFAPVFSLYDYKIKFGRSPLKAKAEGSNPFGSANFSIGQQLGASCRTLSRDPSATPKPIQVTRANGLLKA